MRTAKKRKGASTRFPLAGLTTRLFLCACVWRPFGGRARTLQFVWVRVTQRPRSGRPASCAASCAGNEGNAHAAALQTLPAILFFPQLWISKFRLEKHDLFLISFPHDSAVFRCHRMDGAHTNVRKETGFSEPKILARKYVQKNTLCVC